MSHLVDMNVGKRIRHRRWLLGMTQHQLAEIVGVTFQQIQKYENGQNRVSASRLWEIARAQSVAVNYYFEESSTLDAEIAEQASGREAVELISIYTALSKEQRRMLFDLIKSLSAPK